MHLLDSGKRDKSTFNYLTAGAMVQFRNTKSMAPPPKGAISASSTLGLKTKRCYAKQNGGMTYHLSVFHSTAQ